MGRTIEKLDDIHCNGSLWEKTIKEGIDAVVKAVAFDDERYKVLTYRLIADQHGRPAWILAYKMQFAQPHTDEVFDAISDAFRHTA